MGSCRQQARALSPRQEAVEALSSRLQVTTGRATVALSDTVGERGDPVQQIHTTGQKHVGVIDSDDLVGERRRVVCVRCVNRLGVT